MRFQVLRVGFQIAADDPAVERKLRFLEQSAIQSERVVSTVRYEVRRRGDGYEIWRDEGLEDVQFDPQGVLDAIYPRVQRDALAAWPGSAALRAVVGQWQGRRFGIVGETLWDRSRLALQLIRDGAEIESDDVAILHDGVLTAYPRALRVCGADAPLPARAPPVCELPEAGDPSVGPWALDPALAGIDWRVTTGPLHAAVALETNYGGQTRLSELPPFEMARLLMSSTDPLSGGSHAAGAVASLASRARCYRLRLGSLDDVREVWLDSGQW